MTIKTSIGIITCDKDCSFLGNRGFISDADSYEVFHNAVSAESLTIIEDQAYSLAGHLLMPLTLLNAEIDKLIRAENGELSDSVIHRIIRALAAIFMVSADAMLRQIEKVNKSLHELVSKENQVILVPPYIKPKMNAPSSVS